MPTMKVNIGGVWTPIGAAFAEEVFIGPSEPAPGYELWLDTDESGPQTGWAERLPRGVLGWTRGTATAFSTNSATAVDITVTAGQPPVVSAPLDVGRLYRANFITPVTVMTTAGRAFFELWIAGALAHTYLFFVPQTTINFSAAFDVVFRPPATALTDVRVKIRSDGSNVINFAALSATTPILFSVEDVGAF